MFLGGLLLRLALVAGGLGGFFAGNIVFKTTGPRYDAEWLLAGW